MKHAKKMMALVVACVMMLAMAVPAFAATQTVTPTTADSDNATITINNPSKGQTYSVYKLFDATTTSDGKIAYQGTVPTGMSNYFEETSTGSGYVQAKPAAFKTVTYYTDATKTETSSDATAFWDGEGMSEDLEKALESWVEDQTAVASAESDGSEALAFSGLPYGYYVITTDHEDKDEAKAIITVDSTNPSASVYDKNVTEPTAEKKVEEKNYTIGDTVKYTATFDTTNYLKDSDGEYYQVIQYTISDTLPAFLDDVEVTKITIDGNEYMVNDEVPQFDEDDNTIVIPWATKGTDNKYINLYDNGVQIVVEYEGTLTDVVRVNEDNTNTVTITPKVTDEDGNEDDWDESWDDSAVITTYAAALKKTDGTDVLAGATFAFYGLTVTETADGIYTVVSYDPESTELGTAMTVATGDDTDNGGAEKGLLYIIGLASDVSLKGLETVAPDGYNKLTDEVTLTPQVLSEEVYKMSGYRKYDSDGNIVEEVEEETTDYTQVIQNLDELDEAAVEVINNQGTELPSTGGIGTTIFYVIGAILVIGAGVLLVTKRRMGSEK